MLYNMFSSDLQTPIFLTDNIGAYRDRAHADTINGVSTHFPRKRWSHFFCSHDPAQEWSQPWVYITATS
jgi:hypothetical protein